MPKTFGMSLNISSILGWNMSSTCSAPNGSCLYLYLPNWQANVVRYNDFSSNFKLWYPELASIIDKYLTLLSLGSILFNVWPLCIGLINVWFNCAGSKHSLTLPMALGTNTKLLLHSAILSTPSSVIISICCNLSNSSLNGFCSTYATCLNGAWYGLLSGLSCNKNVPSKHPMPLNTLSNLVYICCVSSALFLLSVSTFGHDRNYFGSVFALGFMADPLLFLLVLRMPSMFIQHFLVPWISCSAFEILAASVFVLQLFFFGGILCL